MTREGSEHELTTCSRRNPYSAFLNGFHGFCGVFVTAAFAYTGTELVGLAAAETKNPEKEIPRASKQVALRIFIFYIVNLFLIGLIVPANSELYSGDGPTSRHSPFVIAIQLAGIKVLPSIFNVRFHSHYPGARCQRYVLGESHLFKGIRLIVGTGMAPKFMAKIDKKGRPISVVIIQLLFGCLAFINLADNGGDIFNWLLALSGLAIIFIYGGIGIAHIRFRSAW
jgi:amino acid transporter